MSRSTTATTTYDLIKYSRSKGGSEAEQEWQHFTNPIIRLIVDAQKKTDGEYQSFKTRVVWSLNSGNDSMDVDQREVIFEDIDMHVLSLTPAAHGLPLKAVYRDTVVGIRYLHPRIVPAGATATFKRFQITFQTSELASSFIDSIRHICPCKANPAPTGTGRGQLSRSRTAVPAPVTPASSFSQLIGQGMPPKTPTRVQPAISQAGSFMSLRPDPHCYTVQYPNYSGSSQPPPETPQARHRSVDERPDTAYMPPTDQAGPPPLAASLVCAAPLTGAISYDNSSTQALQPRHASDDARYSRPSSAVTASSALAADYSGHPYTDSSQSRPDSRLLEQAPHSAPPYTGAHFHGMTALAAPAPVRAPPAPFAAPCPLSAIPPPRSHTAGTEPRLSQAFSQQLASASETQASTSQNILAALEETRSVYDLSRTELENLVAKVVREKDFVRLLKAVDSMWAIKSCLGETMQT